MDRTIKKYLHDILLAIEEIEFFFFPNGHCNIRFILMTLCSKELLSVMSAL